MCRTFFILLFIVECFCSQAQEYRKFRVGFSIGKSQAPSLLYSIEPSLRISDDLSIGVRYENQLFPKIERCYSYTTNVQYYFTHNNLSKKNRYFIGLGLGFYKAMPLYQVVFATQNYMRFAEGVRETRGGFYPRIGFEHNHFSIMLEYNLIYRQRMRFVYFYNYPNQTTTYTTPYFYNSDNYISFKATYSIGGGKKKKIR